MPTSEDKFLLNLIKLDEMTSIDLLTSLSISDACITIGSFDGVHIGHQKILQAVIDKSKSKDIPAIAFSFHPHPAVVLKNIQKPYYLTSPEARKMLLLSSGIDHAIMLHFDREVANLDARSFLEKLKQQTGFTELVIGYDFALGKNREGSAERLQELGREMDYDLSVITPAQYPPGETVSSSRIRNLVSSGSIEKVPPLLGRRFSISGLVIHGDARGRTINIPTANLKVNEQQLLPLNGVYATNAKIAGESYLSVTNIGLKPTVSDGSLTKRTVETHILDFDNDLYGSELTIEFISYLRPEQKFHSVEALKDQINRDITTTRKVAEKV